MGQPAAMTTFSVWMAYLCPLLADGARQSEHFNSNLNLMHFCIAELFRRCGNREGGNQPCRLSVFQSNCSTEARCDFLHDGQT